MDGNQIHDVDEIESLWTKVITWMKFDKIERDESSHMGWNGWHSMIQPCEWN
jgi:hypothetical protein